jgi:hypothetical protein
MAITQDVTLECVCVRCGQGFISVQYPGKSPQYCPKCRPLARREQIRRRVQAHRARRALSKVVGGHA